MATNAQNYKNSRTITWIVIAAIVAVILASIVFAYNRDNGMQSSSNAPLNENMEPNNAGGNNTGGTNSAVQ